MPSLKQISANRLNSQKSTGPRSREGKAASRLNALKTGIDAKSQLIIGESPSQLKTLIVEYYQRWQPVTPEQRCLVDLLISNEWQLRRLRNVEMQLWDSEIENLNDRASDPLGRVFSRNGDEFNRLQRRIDSTDRSYHRALNVLQRLQLDPTPAPNPWPPAPTSEASQSPAPASEASQPPAPELASFHHNAPPPSVSAAQLHDQYRHGGRSCNILVVPGGEGPAAASRPLH